MTKRRNNILSITEFKSNSSSSKNLSTLLDDCTEFINIRDLDTIKNLVNRNSNDIREIGKLIKKSIFSGYIELLDWLLSEYGHIAILVNLELLDNVLMSSNSDMLELILSKYDRLFAFDIIYDTSIDRCILKREYKILEILKKYNIKLPSKRIIYVATHLNIIDEVTPYIF